MILYWVALLIIFIHNIVAVTDYEDNDLAKICRPLNRHLDLLFILDGSGSVSGSTFDTQMAMLNKSDDCIENADFIVCGLIYNQIADNKINTCIIIVEMVEIGPKKTQIAVMQYSSYTRVEFGFNANQNEEELRDALKKIRHRSGTTKTGKALDKALQVFKHDELYGVRVNQEDVAQVAVVVTDGHSHDDPVPAATRLRQAGEKYSGVQILALGIGAHINMGELLDITGDENLSFQNLTSQASLDKFASQFKKIAIGEHCDFSRGPHGAEITCKSDSIEIGVSTVNPFYGHIYVVGQFGHPECVTSTRDSAKEIRLVIGLNSCNIQKQFMVNPKGAMFETSVILKFHPHYNTKKDKVFNVRCFYPEKSPKLPKKLLDNHIGVSDLESPVKMPCSYKLILKTNQCKLEDARVGDEIVHSWQCDREIFDSYQSMLVHSCKLIDVNSGINMTVIDKNGCVVDSAVVDSPEYLEPLSVIAIGRAVKFPDSSLIKMRCKLKFCDRLLGECDSILPPTCRRRRESASVNRRAIREGFPDVTSMNFMSSNEPDEEDYVVDEISISTAPPLLTFASPHIDRKIPPRRRLTIDQRVSASAQGNEKFEQQIFASTQIPLGKIIIGDDEAHIRPVVTSGLTPEGQPKVIEFPVGGMDLKLNTQDVAIVNDESLKKQLQRAMISYPSDEYLTTTPTIDTTVSTTKVVTSTTGAKSPAFVTNKPSNLNTDDPFQEGNEVVDEAKHFEEEQIEVAEVEPSVRLEQKIASSIVPGAAILESQILNVRELETIRDATKKEKWCKK